MADPATKPCVTGLVPMAHVADVQRSADFYKLLGMEMGGRLKNPRVSCNGRGSSTGGAINGHPRV